MGVQGRHVELDPSRCTGCSICMLICGFTKFRKFNPAKSLIKVYYDYRVGRVEGVSVCVNCGLCAERCPSGALRVEGGIVSLNRGLCAGCLTCVTACPRGAIVVVDGGPYKCDLCGGSPQCVRFCARGALYVAQGVRG